jgi:CubicO group peptidase (beta-lactamase class C family)
VPPIAKTPIARFLLLVAALAASLLAQTDPAGSIDAIFEKWNKPSTPGAAVAVIHHGKILYEKGYGIANLEYDIPITPTTIFHVASVSKQFTAMAIVLLERDGKLSIDDDIHKYLQELPDYGYKITLRNLLQHTSGIRDQWQTLATAGWTLEDVITQDQILRMLFRQTALNFPPGTKHLYSNSGFTLLAEIVKRVSGKPMPEFCQERIFRPLGMTHTHFHLDLHQIVKDRAYSYVPAKSGYDNAPLNYANVGATSLFTTAGDLVKWLDNFREPKVGGAAAVARLQEECVLSDGSKPGYGLGVGLGPYRGLRTVSHGGADAGYRSYVLWFPDQELGVAVVSNLGNFNPGQPANQVAALYLSDKMTPEPPARPKPAEITRKFVTLEPAALEPYAGTYPLPKIGQTLEATMADGKLWTVPPNRPRMELQPLGPTHFYVAPISADVEFTPQPAGGMSVKITQPGGVTLGERMPPLTPQELAEYAGVYWSEELETQYAILAREGRLFALHSHHGEIPITPFAKDQFMASRFFFQEVKFIRDDAGKVTAFTVGGGRVAAIRFNKK